MVSWKFRCTLAVFLLAALLAMPLTAEPRVRTERGPGSVWSLLAEVWNKLTAVWEANGCSIDPFGGCVTSAPSSDNGCKIDPFGGCVTSAPTSDNGCTIDPYGGCGSGN